MVIWILYLAAIIVGIVAGVIISVMVWWWWQDEIRGMWQRAVEAEDRAFYAFINFIMGDEYGQW